MSLRTVLLLGACAALADANMLVARPRQPANQAAVTPHHMAMVLPPDSIAEVVVVEGGVQFLSLYTGLITLRILLSWFPQAQSVSLLQPLFTVSDAYLNLFRGIVPPIGGIDISPIGAFFVLNLLTNSVAGLGATNSGNVNVVAPPFPGTRVVKALRARIDGARASRA